MDGPIDTTAAGQGTIGGIHDGIHSHRSDIACRQPHARAVPPCLAHASGRMGVVHGASLRLARATPQVSGLSVSEKLEQ
jgi:hypothetical protein